MELHSICRKKPRTNSWKSIVILNTPHPRENYFYILPPVKV
jgi:hypothetical protein